MNYRSFVEIVNNNKLTQIFDSNDTFVITVAL